MKYLIPAKHFLIFCKSKVDQQARLFESVLLPLLHRNSVDLSECSAEEHDGV